MSKKPRRKKHHSTQRSLFQQDDLVFTEADELNPNNRRDRGLHDNDEEGEACLFRPNLHWIDLE
jgi:hypothetical protein